MWNGWRARFHDECDAHRRGELSDVELRRRIRRRTLLAGVLGGAVMGVLMLLIRHDVEPVSRERAVAVVIGFACTSGLLSATFTYLASRLDLSGCLAVQRAIRACRLAEIAKKEVYRRVRRDCLLIGTWFGAWGATLSLFMALWYRPSLAAKDLWAALAFGLFMWAFHSVIGYWMRRGEVRRELDKPTTREEARFIREHAHSAR